MSRWTASDVPDQSGRRVIVTGATAGIGFETALQLAAHGAHVVLAARDPGRGKVALDRILARVPGASVEVADIDLADLDTVRGFAAAYGQAPLDLLINNAGVMAVPRRELTRQGFERQFGTNHLGHFALTMLLLPALLRAPGSRVVTVSSDAHRRWGADGLDVDDLMSERSYRPMVAYSRSKLANALFTLELDRRLRAGGAETISVGAHPGFTSTNLMYSGPRSGGTTLAARVGGLGSRIAAQPAARGALPQLYAATAPGVQGGQFFGPDGLLEWRGYPTEVRYSKLAHDERLGTALWRASERLTGVPAPAPLA